MDPLEMAQQAAAYFEQDVTRRTDLEEMKAFALLAIAEDLRSIRYGVEGALHLGLGDPWINVAVMR